MPAADLWHTYHRKPKVTKMINDEPNHIPVAANIEWAQKMRILAVVATIIIISHLPLFMGRIFLVENHISKNDVLYFLFLPFLTFALMIICPLFAAKRFSSLASFDRTWTTKPRTKIRWFLLLGASILGANIVIGLLAMHFGWPKEAVRVVHHLSGEYTLFFIITNALLCVIIGPFAEEFLWRGYALRQFEKTLGSFIALFLQSFLFAALHFRPILGFTVVFLWGLIFGLWRLKKQSLMPVIVVHMIMNTPFIISRLPGQIEAIKVKIKTNYVAKLNELGRPANPDDNAEPYYTKAADLCVLQPSELGKVEKNAWPGELTAEQQEILEHWLGENENALAQLKKGTKKPYYCPTYRGDYMMEVDMTLHLHKYRHLAYALCWRAKTEAVKGNLDTAIDDILTSCRLGEHFTLGPKILIGQLVGIAIEKLALNSGFSILDKAQVDTAVIKYMQNELESLAENQNPYIDLRAEKLMVYDNIQRAFTDDGDGGGHITRINSKPTADSRVLLPAIAKNKDLDWEKLDRRETTELADKLYEFMEIMSRKTPAQWREDGLDFDKEAYEIIEGNGFLVIFMPAIGKVSELSHKSRVSIEALITTLAILQYEANEGQLPKTLDELIANEYLKHLPMDPYSDKSLVYETTDDSFTLYSIGADFDDDGGKHDKKWGADDGDYVFWPVKRPEKTTETKNDTPNN
jgi:membrane protease YdiL (CAAX protease family)